MIYHFIGFGQDSKWMDDLMEAAVHINQLKIDGKYITIGVTKGSYTVDVVTR